MRTTFKRFNFSFIFRGGGKYTCGTEKIQVIAPCVITQRSDLYVEYGPDGRYKSWEELYLIYSLNDMEKLTKRGFLKRKKYGWEIKNRTPCFKLFSEIKELITKKRNIPYWIDKLDRLCEQLIFESLLNIEEDIEKDPTFKPVKTIEQYITTNPYKKHNFYELADEQNLSYPTFLRYWLKHFKIPPLRYQRGLCIREACKLLAETKLPIKQISDKVGFSDPLYFCRVFHQEKGVSPSEYRKRNKYL
jgi:AraC-like DNA-binding protein